MATIISSGACSSHCAPDRLAAGVTFGFTLGDNMNSVFSDGLSRRQVIQRAAAAASFSAFAESFVDAQTASGTADSDHHTTKEDFVRLMTELSNWNRWGKDDQMGAVNLITPAKRKQAVGLVKEGACFSMARNAEMEKAVDNANPVVRKMLRVGAAS